MSIGDMIFDGWNGPWRAIVLTPLAYGALVILLRVSGKRTLSKMNVFVVALGSTLATTILSADVTLFEGIVALAALIALQVLLSWLCILSHWLERCSRTPDEKPGRR